MPPQRSDNLPLVFGISVGATTAAGGILSALFYWQGHRSVPLLSRVFGAITDAMLPGMLFGGAVGLIPAVIICALIAAGERKP